MSIWIPADTFHEPVVTLNEWSVYQFDNGDRILVGARWPEGTGRISSPIKAYDKAAKEMTTESGRVYKLLEPGKSYHGEYVFMLGYGKQISEANVIDVTEEYI